MSAESGRCPQTRGGAVAGAGPRGGRTVVRPSQKPSRSRASSELSSGHRRSRASSELSCGHRRSRASSELSPGIAAVTSSPASDRFSAGPALSDSPVPDQFFELTGPGAQAPARTAVGNARRERRERRERALSTDARRSRRRRRSSRRQDGRQALAEAEPEPRGYRRSRASSEPSPGIAAVTSSPASDPLSAGPALSDSPVPDQFFELTGPGAKAPARTAVGNARRERRERRERALSTDARRSRRRRRSSRRRLMRAGPGSAAASGWPAAAPRAPRDRPRRSRAPWSGPG